MNFSPTDYNRLLTAVNHAQESYIVDRDPELIFQGLLNSFLELTGSEFGFIARVVHHNESLFYLNCQASNIPFEKDANSYFASLGENPKTSTDDLKNLLHSLVYSAEPVLFNATTDNPESLKCTPVSANLVSFMGIPLSSQGHLSGVICLLNRPGDYSPAWVGHLQPVSKIYLKLSQALESDQQLVKMYTESQKQQELKYQSLFQLSPDAIIIGSLNEYLDCNQAAEDMFGLESPAELLGLRLGELSPDKQPDGRSFQEVMQVVSKELSKNSPVKFEWIFRRRNGEVFPTEVAIAKVLSLVGPDVFQLVIRDQSVSKEQEKKLKQQDQQRQEILAASPVGIVISNFKTAETIFANQAVHEMLCVTNEQLESSNKLLFWADQDDLRYCTERLQKTGKVQREVRLLTRQGKEIFCQLTWQWNPGTTDEVLAWLIDITHIKNIESDLVRQQSLQKSILDQLPVALSCKEVSNDFRYTFCNQMFLELFSPQDEEWIGKTDFDFYPREEAERIRQQDLLAVTSSCPIVKAEEYLGRRDSENILISTRKTCLPDENGKHVLLLGISEDITERREAERTLQASERRFRELAEHAPVGIFLTDVNGACLFVNQPWQKMTGLDQEQAAGDGWKDAIYEEDLPAVLAMWSDFMLGQSSFAMEYRLISPLGHIAWVNGSAVPFRNDSGQTLGFLGANSDITQSKLYAAELTASRDDANRANQAKSEFLSRMSHELRNPLNAILGFGQLLQLSNNNLTISQNEGVNHILNAGELLLHLIEDILDLSRIDTGHVSLRIQVTNVEQIIKNSMALMNSQAHLAGVSIQQSAGEALNVIADPHRLQQALVNLLTNAVKYNKPGGWVTLSSQRCEDSRVRIQVQDNGKGIHPRDQSRIGQPFERVLDPDTVTEGTGIGLSISKKLVEMMGGKVGFSSELNKGSTFWIELPDSEPVSSFESELAGELTERFALLKDFRIAYIEDDLASISLMAKTICRLQNCELQTAYNGADGVSLAKSTRPDLVLMDLNLSGMESWKALAELKEDERTRNIPVVAFSDSASIETQERALQAGFSGFLAKPVRFKELFEVLLAASNRTTD